MTREEAMDFVSMAINRTWNEKTCKEILKALEHQTGKWILTIEDWNKWTCSECGWHTRTDTHVTLGYSFCPNCGADMRKESHEDTD